MRTNINFTRLAYLILFAGGLLYSFFISDMLTWEMREMVDTSLEVGFYLGYGLWVLGIVLANSSVVYRITRRNHAGSSGIVTGLQIWYQTIVGTFDACVRAPIRARNLLGAYEGLLQKLISSIEIYLLRPVVSIIWLVIYAALSPLVILPVACFVKAGGAGPEEEQKDGVGLLPVAYVTGSDSARKSLLQALTSAMESVSVPRWHQYDTPRIKASAGMPKYSYGEVLLSRNRNSKLPSHSLQICNFEGCDTAAVSMLDSMPFYSHLKAAILVVEENTSPATWARAFDKWYELMTTAHKPALGKLKCAVIIQPAAKQSSTGDDEELYAGADADSCKRFLRDHHLADVIQKAALFKNTRFFAVTSDSRELNECPGIHATAKWVLQEATR